MFILIKSSIESDLLLFATIYVYMIKNKYQFHNLIISNNLSQEFKNSTK